MIETPGEQPHTRGTWRNVTSLRGVLMDCMVSHPDVTREELEALYLARVCHLEKLKTLPTLVAEALRYKFDRDFANLHKSELDKERRERRRKLTEEEIAAAAARVRTIVLLDLVLPNGKRLRDCTGLECREQGQLWDGLLNKIADRIGDDVVVGTELTEKEVQDIRGTL